MKQTKFPISYFVMGLGIILMVFCFALAYYQFRASPEGIAADIEAAPYGLVSFIRFIYLALMFVIGSVLVSKGIQMLVVKEVTD